MCRAEEKGFQHTLWWPIIAVTAMVCITLSGGIDTVHAQEKIEIMLQGQVVDASSGDPIPARVYIQDAQGQWYNCDSDGGTAAHYRREPQHTPKSVEVNTTLSAHPFKATLAPGNYTFRVEHGKDYLPIEREVVVTEKTPPLEFRLQRWINMAARGWYSGDTHTHRKRPDLDTILLAEDLNVAFPLNYWVIRCGELPGSGKQSTKEALEAKAIAVDATHVIYPLNTEYELVQIKGKEHTLGAVFVLNHKTKLDLAGPPVAPIAARARAEGALLDLDKHSWPWSLMLVPVMDVDLFELSNNHHWQTEFGFTKWTLDKAPAYMQLEMNEDGFTEWGWTEFGFKTYYALLNCGYRMRVSAGTASGVHPVQLGFGRVYVRLPEGFSYDAWMEGLDAGRSFVSTGPLLDLRFNQQDAGHSFQVQQDERFSLRITGSAFSQQPLDRIEVIQAGAIAATLPVTNRARPGGGFETVIAHEMTFDHSAWIAVRCFEADPNNRIRFAHSNPVFVDLEEKPLYPRKEETDYLVQRMEEELARNRGVLDAASVAEYEQALAAFSEKARR